MKYFSVIHAAADIQMVMESDAVEVCQHAIATLDADKQLKILSELFSTYLQHNSCVSPPHDLLKLLVLGMERLKNAGRKNVIYLLAKALGTPRPDGSDSLLPVSRMPMGLLEHMVNFFTASSVQQVGFYCEVTILW